MAPINLLHPLTLYCFLALQEMKAMGSCMKIKYMQIFFITSQGYNCGHHALLQIMGF
jgi:hypothetical protein